ncbi:MAG: hypothetical protein SLAVMIC_01007 [uncultured marine phage]|uniref:Uncharacterized protein n=1 Tax=uncultured marine phage TaxID=707152 RepID=A0A8D9C9W9_9VIRU|nr:MAG: hypothetical protein SLAVMIC_01007 [uncultured marine phage]
MKNLKNIDTKVLYNSLDKIKIFKDLDNDGDIRINTQFGDRLIKQVNVSEIYEIFDFGPFAKEVVEKLINDFGITKYDLTIKGGLQELVLEGEEINIKGKTFKKRFYVLSSSDKSRRLQLNFGLYSEDFFFTIISSQGMISRKHINGLNDVVDDMLFFDNDVFDDTIELMDKIIGDTILLSQVEKVILELDKEDADQPNQTNELKLKSFKNTLLYSNEVTREDLENDRLELDAFLVFRSYLYLFRNRDSYIVKKETKKISRITKAGFREERLALLLG